MKRAAPQTRIWALLTGLAIFGSGAFAATPAPTAAQAAATQEEQHILEYDSLLRAADRYISEGDYPAALEQLHQALALRPGDASFYERLAIAYDADREPAQAFEYFERAGNLYLAAGALERADKVFEYLRVSGLDKQRVDDFAQKLNRARAKHGH